MQIHRITARQALNHVGGDPYDYDLNIYRGCAHRCRYCFAIYSQEFLKPQAGETNFFEDIFIKDNIVELLERRLASPHWTGAVINIGGVTDSYQPVEAREKRMPEILRLMIRYRNPITISTKSVLMLRDLDLFDELSRLTYVGIASTVTTLDEPVRRVIEPGAAPSPGPAGDAPGICPAHPGRGGSTLDAGDPSHHRQHRKPHRANRSHPGDRRRLLAARHPEPPGTDPGHVL